MSSTAVSPDGRTVRASVGRIVHVCIGDEAGKRIMRPAIVVRAWATEGLYVADDGINCQLFADGVNDTRHKWLAQHAGDLSSSVWLTSILYSEVPKVGCWSWPGIAA